MSKPLTLEGIVNAAIYNFAAHLVIRPSPMVIGEGYPYHLLVDAIKDWAETHGLNPEVAVDNFEDLVKFPEFKRPV
jgi:hypothetical protein